MNVLVLSQKQLEQEFLIKFFHEKYNKDIDITVYDCHGCNMPDQPLIDDHNEGQHFCKKLLNYAKTKKNLDNYDYVLSIVDGLFIGLGTEYTYYLLIYHKGIMADGTSFSIPIEAEQIEKFEKVTTEVKYSAKIYGHNKSFSDVLADIDPSIDKNNWTYSKHKIDKNDHIIYGIKKALDKLNKRVNDKMELMNAYKSYQDYPKEGVLFHDIFPLFKDRKLLKRLVKLVSKQYIFDDIDYVIGLESRGFCLGTVVAYELGVGFIPVRKEGKLPGKTIKLSYNKEYGKDTCEMQYDVIKGKKVLIIDDLIATGGSMKVSIDLLLLLECEIVDCCVLREVPQLREMYKEALEGMTCSVLLQ